MIRTHEAVFKDDRCIDVRTMCNFPKGIESFFRKVDFVKHLTDRHNIACSVESYTFASELEFRNWKEKEEVKSLAYFIKRRGDPCGKTFNMFITIANVTMINVYTELMKKKIIMQREKCIMEV